jgi:predicted Zn-dependent peptidase
MAMESERFLNPVLREMYRERNVIAEERRQTLENNPIRRLLTAMTAAAFIAHPYHVPIVGYMSDIQNYTREAARAYFKKYYVPSNMAIAVVGDVDPDNVFKLAKKYWGRIPYSPPPEPLNTVEPKQEGEREVILEDPAQPFLAIAWHIPSETDPDFPVIEAMMDHLGQGRTSLLYETMVKKDKIAADVGSFAGYPGTKYPTLAVAYAIPASEHSNEECETAILAEIKKMQETPLSAEDVEHIKARAKAQFINSLTSNMGMAMRLATYEMRWGDWRELFRELDRINAVTADDIQRVANKYFIDENRTVAMLNTIQS